MKNFIFGILSVLLLTLLVPPAFAETDSFDSDEIMVVDAGDHMIVDYDTIEVPFIPVPTNSYFADHPGQSSSAVLEHRELSKHSAGLATNTLSKDNYSKYHFAGMGPGDSSASEGTLPGDGSMEDDSGGPSPMSIVWIVIGSILAVMEVLFRSLPGFANWPPSTWIYNILQLIYSNRGSGENTKYELKEVSK